MNPYLLIKVLHILSAFALVGPLLLAPKWLYLARHEIGRAALRDLHRLTGLAGWAVLLSGGALLALQNGGMLFSFWMELSISLFAAVQLFDHFWADPRENELERHSKISDSALKVWLVSKLGIHILIAALMVLKPGPGWR